jgi:amidase
VDSTELAFAGLSRQAELVRAGEVSSRELVELYLARIERIDPQLNSFRAVFAERALADADQADSRRAAGDDRPLLGVPIALKDNHDLAGDVTTHGTLAYGEPAREDCELTRRLRAAGAVIVGKTTLPELAIIGDTESLGWGVTRNPWNVGHTPGGSSGGSGAAVAAGLCAGASASDGAGSIRIPAACCGLFGLKPQRGRVSLMPEAEHWYGMSVNGCLTRSVRDTALFLDSVAGPAPGDRHTPPPPQRPFSASAAETPGKLRIALSLRPTTPVPVHSEIKRAVRETAELLRSLGHEVSERNPAYNEIGLIFLPRYFRGQHDDAWKMAHPDRLQRRTRQFAAIGGLYSDSVLEWTRRDEQRQAARILSLFDDHDVLLTPMLAKPPVRSARWEGLDAVRTALGMLRAYPFGAPWNALGNPAAAVPAGFTPDGLPLSVQLVGRPNDEGTLLSLAAQIEAERPWADARPALAAEA